MSDTGARSSEKPSTGTVVGGMVVAGILGLVVATYSVGAADKWTAFAVQAALVAASAASGAVIGFLFGMPRYREADETAAGYKPSTNLEQVSDWMTKILIGAGLVQATAVARGIDGLLDDQVVPALGDEPGAYIVGLGLIVTCAIGGFLLGWLGARLYLEMALRRADEAAVKISAVAAEIQEDRPEEAQQLWTLAASVGGARQAPMATAAATQLTPATDYEARVATALQSVASDLGFDVLTGRAAQSWDAVIVVDDDRWGVEFKFVAGPLMSSTIRFLGGRALTAKRSVAGVILVTNGTPTPVSERELAIYRERVTRFVLIHFEPTDSDDVLRDALLEARLDGP